jgi:hypothetical protein
MSVRAYRINHIDFQDDPSFNLWHDESLMQFLAGRANISEDRIGVDVEVLEKVVNKAKELGLNEWQIKALQDDIKWAKDKGDTYIEYECF